MTKKSHQEVPGLTDIRRMVLRIVQQAKTALKAYDILERLQKEKPNAQPPTVYRALHYLVEHRYLHRVHSNQTYTVCQFDGQAGDQHGEQVDILFVCRQCSDVCELIDPVFSALLAQLSEQKRFSLDRSAVEFSGLCQRCH